MPNGNLRVYTTVAGQSAPLAGVVVTIWDESGAQRARILTDDSGASPDISLSAPDRALSLDESNTTVRPYAVYRLTASLEGWRTQTIDGVQIFDGQTAVARLEFLPNDVALASVRQADVSIPEHPLFIGGGSSAPAPQGEPLDARVLNEVVIPRTITVHLGAPTSSARNVTVSFQDYIANVASSEVYPTWPEEALRANILAQISLALNRIYTEWYPSRGYSFNITGSPGYDQAYVDGRTVFDVMERLTAELFSTFVRRSGFAEPYFTEYCDGKTVTCAGMKQWGTVDRANEGKNALQILRYYYGSSIELATSSNLTAIPESYPGTPLRLGSTGTAVSVLQKQLSRIAKDYPGFGKPDITGTFDTATENSVKAFQKYFSLTADGVVGRSTWYKISYIYVSVKDLAELTSEGEEFDAVISAGAWPGVVLRRGSTGTAVEQVQFWLSGLAEFDSSIPSIAVDGNFGAGTERAVIAFQKSAGLTADGIVGRLTWDALYAAWVNAQSDIGGTAWPGTVLRSGSKGNSVRQVQFWLLLAAGNYSMLPSVTVDGSYGSATTAAVTAFQTYFGLAADGAVGRVTWNKLNEVGIAVANELVDPNIQPGQFVTTLRLGSSGTPVRAAQYYLRILSAYYPAQPTLTVDGVFGQGTQKAVIAWQQHAGLTADGVIGRLTWQSIYQNAIELASSGSVARARTAPDFTATLAPGDSGPDVVWLARTMQFLAAWLDGIQPPDSQTLYFGDSLEASVRSAQRTFALPETGVVDADDWATFNAAALALLSSTPPAARPEPDGIWPGHALTQGSAGPAVLQVQRWLNILASVRPDALFVPETGVLDAETQTALQSYQIRAGLEPLGIVDDATWQSLQAAAAPYERTLRGAISMKEG